MVRAYKFCICLMLMVPSFIFSESFQATVSRNPINVGESFTLTFTLNEAKAIIAPSFEVIKPLLTLQAQHQSTSVSFLNGQMTTSHNWTLSLIAQTEGEITIPAIIIETNKGRLESLPIPLKVVKGEVGKEADPLLDLRTEVEVGNFSPYKNESFLYTIRLISKRHLENVNIVPLQMEGAIVESVGNPKGYEKFVDGVLVAIVEHNYMITPLKSGSLKIPPVSFQGDLLIKRKAQSRSFFNQEHDPFSMMQGLKPFVVQTKESNVSILPPIASVQPWLAAKSLTLKETFKDQQTYQEGEFFNRTIEIQAEGLKASQIPSLQELQTQKQPFKIYADKPETSEEVKDKVLTSFRKETYTFVPEASGSLELPEISIEWWNVETKEKEVTKLPARKLNVLPATVKNVETESVVPPETIVRQDSWLYILIVGLLALIVGFLFWVQKLQKRIQQMTNPLNELHSKPKSKVIKKIKPIKDKNEKLPDLNPT